MLAANERQRAVTRGQKGIQCCTWAGEIQRFQRVLGICDQKGRRPKQQQHADGRCPTHENIQYGDFDFPVAVAYIIDVDSRDGRGSPFRDSSPGP